MARWIFRLDDELAARADELIGDDRGARSKWLVEAVQEKLARSADFKGQDQIVNKRAGEVFKVTEVPFPPDRPPGYQGFEQPRMRPQVDRADAFRLAEARRQALKGQKP